jgi:tetratricopeptide (TPR) repeat protein
MKTYTLLLMFLMTTLPGMAQGKKSASYYFSAGEQALDENKYTQALAHFNECIRLDPYFMEAYQSRAAAKEGLGDTKGALTDYSIYVDSRPDRPDALLSRAVLRYQLGQYLTAREDFLMLLKMPPGETNKVVFRQDPSGGGTDKMFTMQGANHAGIFNYLGLVETRLKNYEQAFLYLDSALKLDPREPNYYVNRGIVKENVRDTLGAIADYQRALFLDPSNGLALHNVAVIRRTQGEQDESEKLLDEAILQSPNLPHPYAARAYYRLNHKDLRGALDDYDKVLELNKNDEESWLYRGMVKEKLKDNDGAFIDYTQAISLKNDYSRAWLSRGTLLTKLNRWQDAVEDYTVAITWYPDFGLAFYNRAIARQKLGKLKEACEDLAQAEKLGVKTPPGLKEKACK